MKRIKFISAALVVVFITSCATMFNGRTSDVTFESEERTADLLVIDGKDHNNVYFPYTTKVQNGSMKTKVVAKKDGYEDCTFEIDKKINNWYFANIISWTLPGILVDLITGSYTDPQFDKYDIDFKPSYGSIIGERQAYQERNNQVLGNGDTALESTVIRWYVVSSPAGADVQWRVVSSTPDVKNTNQSYLGSTPYESTESFDIMGLTYNNSGNVQIEVSCEKSGYVTQRKRFNVRQAIDQKEISTKFNLVPEE